MKFTKEEAVQSMTAKFADKAKGIDLARTIEEAVSNCMEMVGEDSEMELDAFLGFVEKNVSSALGLAKHLKKTATTEMQQQLDELKRKIEGQQTPPPPKQDEIRSDDPAMQAILDKLSKMEAKLQEKDKENAIADKRSQLVAKMKESIKDEDWINSYLAEINITEEMDVEAKAKDYIAFYNKTSAGGGRRSTTPRKTGEGDNEDADVKSALEKAKALMQQRETVMGSSPVETKKV